MSRWAAVVVGFVLLLQLGSLALADQASDDALARKYYELGQSLYGRADYEGAIKQFEDSYRLSRRPALLFNIGRTRENLGQHEEAIRVYERYLQTRPQDAAEVAARLANLRQLVERKRLEAQQAQQAQQALVAPTAEPRPRLGGPWLSWSLVGTGVAVLATGAVLTGLAKAAQNEVEQDNRLGVEYTTIKSTADRGRAFGIVGPVLLGLGGASVVAGVTLLVLQHRAVKERRAAWLSPVLAPGVAALSLQGSF